MCGFFWCQGVSAGMSSKGHAHRVRLSDLLRPKMIFFSSAGSKMKQIFWFSPNFLRDLPLCEWQVPLKNCLNIIIRILLTPISVLVFKGIVNLLFRSWYKRGLISPYYSYKKGSQAQMDGNHKTQLLSCQEEGELIGRMLLARQSL